MTRTTKEKGISAGCVALDGSICRLPLSEDGMGILCEKHLARLRIGEEITLSKQAGDAAAANLTVLASRVKGTAVPSDKADDSIGKEGETAKGKEKTNPDRSSSDLAISLVSVAVLSMIVTAYAALVLQFQAPQIKLPLGLTLSGFNSTTAVLQALPHGLIVLLLSASLLIVLSLGISACLGGIMALIWALQHVLNLVGLGLATVWRGVAIGNRIMEVLRLHRTDQAKPGRIERTLIWMSAQLASLYLGLKHVQGRVGRGIRGAMRFPYKVVLVGEGPHGQVMLARIALFALVLLLGIPLAIWSAADRERQIQLMASENEACRNYVRSADCPDPEPHWVLDLADRSAAQALERARPAAVNLTDGYAQAARALVTEHLPYYVSQLPLWGRNLLRPSLAMGTFVYSSRDTAPTASHVLAREETLQNNSFRTEKLIHIGDYGVWAFVAKAENPDQRLLIRRDAMMEFATSPEIEVLNPQRQQADNGHSAHEARLRGAQALNAHLRGQVTWLHAQMEAMRAHLAGLNTGALEALASVVAEGVDRFLIVQVTKELAPLQNGGVAGLPDLEALLANGVASRVPGVLHDLIRHHGAAFAQQCRIEGTALTPVGFLENQAQWPIGRAPEAYQDALDHFADLAAVGKAGSRQWLVLLLGGASFTGHSTANLRLSEARAKWVKSRLLSDLLGSRRGNVADLDTRATSELGLTFVALGLGERINSGVGASRAVEVLVCAVGQHPTSRPAEFEEVAKN